MALLWIWNSSVDATEKWSYLSDLAPPYSQPHWSLGAVQTTQARRTAASSEAPAPRTASPAESQAACSEARAESQAACSEAPAPRTASPAESQAGWHLRAERAEALS